MKHVIALFLGLLCGAALFAMGLYFNPFVGAATVSPLELSRTGLHRFTYSTVPGDSILFTNDGDSISQPYPDTAAELWESTIVDTRLLVTNLLDVRGHPVGIGIKMSSPSEKTRLLNSEILVNSVWHLYVPGQGTLVIDQTENYWSYLRDIVIAAWRSSADSWRGNWSRNMTVGPGALGIARVTGLSGEFNGQHGEAVESLNARAYSILQGPASMTGEIGFTIADKSEPIE